MTDPYTDTAACVARLLKMYAQHPRLLVAVDFDDTLFDFHKTGAAYPRAVAAVRAAQAAGFYITIFTASAKDRYPFIMEHCRSLGIVPDAINRNVIPSPFGNDGKIFYNIFLDDRAGLGQALDILEQTLAAIAAQTT